ncbi:MAG: penicillin-binding transpeptidase domain-containing protein [Ruminococcus sp.]|nr:penicillin-binding transpeptidase domain-containing protein [Ruminococcus sp.]
MGIGRNKNKGREKGPNQRLRQRTAIIIVIILLFGFGAAITRLGYLTTVQSAQLQEAAVDQQLKDTELPAKRGTIYDSKGKVLAESASVWQVVMAPKYFETDEQREVVAEGLSSILGLEKSDLLEKTKEDSYYVVVKRKIESEARTKILEFIKKIQEEYDCNSYTVQLLDDYKRYYPNNELASCVIGFTGSDEQGLEGIEYEYDDYLRGTPGRIVTAKNSLGTEMPFQYEQNVDAENGNNLYLTIDATVQSICEKYMADAILNYNILNRGVCIAMDVNTGAILAMVTSDGYDLNDPYKLTDSARAKILALPENERAEAESAALSAMWRNKAVADTYEPGSVFKICTASMALEEGLIHDNTSFFCGGSMTIADAAPIHCHATEGHGTQSFTEIICHSCNPGFMQIGQKLGIKKFTQYYEGFGFSERTGIDLPGEADDQYFADMGEVDLAVASFGQNFKITPIQMITACSAVANGGYVLEPHVVSKITDSEGNVVKSVEKKVKRQIVSSVTSEKMSSILEFNSTSSGRSAGYVAGYKVGGKTGTSEKKGITEKQSQFKEDYIASFCGFAPADDPQIAMLVFFDTPDGDVYYGSQIAAPVFVDIMSEVLPYLDIRTDYTEEELEFVDVAVGSYTGLPVAEAESLANADGFTVTIKGEGDTVLSQIPSASSSAPNGANIVLYTDNASKTETVEVPDLSIGYTVSEVNSVASAYGLNVSLVGASSSSSVISASQDIAPGMMVPEGTVITVKFVSSVSVSD